MRRLDAMYISWTWLLCKMHVGLERYGFRTKSRLAMPVVVLIGMPVRENQACSLADDDIVDPIRPFHAKQAIAQAGCWQAGLDSPLPPRRATFVGCCGVAGASFRLGQSKKRRSRYSSCDSH